MISSAYKCGCPIHNPQEPEASVLFSKPRNLNSWCSHSTAETDSEDDENSCGCCSESDEEEEETPKIVSEIEQKGLPYKEIEAIINDNRMVVRIQKEKPPPEYEPPCECVELSNKKSEVYNAEPENPRRSNIVFQKANEGCRTISVYPHPDPKVKSPKSDKFDKKDDLKKPISSPKKHIEFPTVNPEENPNIFVLKIKRKCESQDIKHNLDLEFRTPRPWRKKDYLFS